MGQDIAAMNQIEELKKQLEMMQNM